MNYLLNNWRNITVKINNVVDTNRAIISKLLDYNIMLEYNSITPLEEVIPRKLLLTSNKHFGSIKK